MYYTLEDQQIICYTCIGNKIDFVKSAINLGIVINSTPLVIRMQLARIR